MMGLNGGEFVIIAVIALLVIGPERLPHYASQLARLVRELRRMATGAREQVRAELGPEFDDVDWQKLDPRQYDPRRIVREALQEAWDDPDDAEPVSTTKRKAPAEADLKKPSRPAARPGGGASRPGDTTGPAPFDTDAT
ncbi:twin-arginine translocase TatA/TatE family subunit [Angustibacter speluncae]